MGEQYLIPLLGVWDSFDEIDFSTLPDSFVLKCNHGSGWNMVVKDKKALDIYEARQAFYGWMRSNYGLLPTMERQYRDISAKIMAEAYLSGLETGAEYQFWCMNGEPEFVSVVHAPHGVNSKITFDMEWNELPFVTSLPRFSEKEKRELAKPDCFDEMIDIIKTVCKDFIFVRVDLYLAGGKPFFGEMTFTPAAGVVNWDPEDYDAFWGERLLL